ncbi:MAG: hypothetical protein D5R96_06540 [Methanocalculus sp. MSAO_Arc2]|uniref:hypothetical protein n=1 Tax=Methanocalculus sp. MSAO_Arc2 TaxID=2293855 RepID=UPI000FF4B7E0|nr:MAG: hypothetical protein D5R96_06540 [Methanocalculus sp. MSAO_Arc2]
MPKGILHEILDVSKATLEYTKESIPLQNLMLDKQDLMLQTGKETKEEIVRLRQETGKSLDDEFKEIKKKPDSIEDALHRAGIQV